MAGKGGDAITTIQLRKQTRDRLAQLGRKGETYDAILNRLLDQAGQQHVPERAAGHGRRHRGVVDFEPVE